MRLLEVAEVWQSHHRRTTDEAIEKVAEELTEYQAAEGNVDKLDELGDVIVNALRALTTLGPLELEFMVRVMEMKADRRTGDGGVKDKVAEAEHVAILKDHLLDRHDCADCGVLIPIEGEVIGPAILGWRCRTCENHYCKVCYDKPHDCPGKEP